MASAKDALTLAEARRIFSYDPSTGKIFNLVYRGAKAPKGAEAGCLDPDGYILIGYKARYMKAHRLAWFLTYGEWPEGFLDHINGIPGDNRILNLREASFSENACNSRKKKQSISGVKGVYWSRHARKWEVRITAYRQRHHIGLFTALSDAIEAVRIARERLHGEFARHA